MVTAAGRELGDEEEVGVEGLHRVLVDARVALEAGLLVLGPGRVRVEGLAVQLQAASLEHAGIDLGATTKGTARRVAVVEVDGAVETRGLDETLCFRNVVLVVLRVGAEVLVARVYPVEAVVGQVAIVYDVEGEATVAELLDVPGRLHERVGVE